MAAYAWLPTSYGKFTVFAFLGSDGKEHLALVKGDINARKNVPVRVHSSCLTGDALGSLKCDCGQQLAWALKYIQKKGFGAVLYLQQEGRGIGLANKIFAYHLQDHGLDTVEANTAQGLPVDARDFRMAAKMLEILGVESVELMTNNPNKVRALKRCKVKVVARIPIQIKSNRFNQAYLQVKKAKMGHLLK